MSWAAIAATVAGAALSAGMAAATAPDYADPKASSRKVVLAGLRALPGQRKVEAAARLGEAVEYETGQTQKLVRMPVEEALAKGLITPEKAAAQGRLGNDFVFVKDLKGKTVTADFTGYGDADVQGEMARKMAQIGLDLQKKYGRQFVDEAKKQQELADPEGTEARRMLAEEINREEEARKTRVRPVSESLAEQIGTDLASGRAVDSGSSEAIARTLSRRGGTTLASGDIEAELAAGQAGDKRLHDRIQQAMGFASSGSTPTDYEYRDRQQSLANMASFLGGRTPQSQFAGMGAAQQGANPNPQGAGLIGLTGNLQQVGNAAGLQNYQMGVQQAANNVSPWFAGLAAAAKGAGVAADAGWQPFKQG